MSNNDARAETIRRWEVEGWLVSGCPGCQEFYNAPDPSKVIAPDHDPSRHCESGKRPHCTCDTCF